MIRKAIFIFLSIIIIAGIILPGNVSAAKYEDGVFIEKISAGQHFTIAIKPDGSLIGWGSNEHNVITNIPTGNDFVQVSSGYGHAVALRENGTLVSWGRDHKNQVTNTPTDTDFKQVSAGAGHTTALKENGTLVTWGNNDPIFGSIVSNTPTGSDFIQVSSGLVCVVALRSNGSIVAWGYNASNQVSHTPTTTGWKQVSSGMHNNAAVRPNGQVFTWGNNAQNTVSHNPATLVHEQVAVGEQYVLTLRSDGAIQGWGYNGSGVITNIPAGNDYVYVTAGVDHAVALKSDGTLVSWGSQWAAGVPSGNFGEDPAVEDVTSPQKTVQGYTDITVTWEDPIDSDTVNVYLNDVYVGNTTLEQYEFTGLDPATEYKITLENEFESEIAAGVDVFYSTKTIQNVTGIITDFVTPTEMSLTWTDAPDYDSYDIYLDGAFLKNIIIPYTMITDLQPDLQYEIEIVTDIEGHKSSGIKYFETTADSPFIVTGLHVDYKTDEMIRIAYNEYPNAELYKIYVDDVYEGETSSLYYNITGLLQDTAYRIEITAVIGTWESDLSLPITVYTEASMEAVIPQNVVLLDSGTAYLQVGWDNEPLNTFYEVMVDNEAYGATNGDEITILNLDYATDYLVAVRSVKQHNSWTYESDWVYNTFSTAEIPPGVTYLTLLQEKMYSIVIQWDYVPEATKYRIYVNNNLYSIHEHDDPNQLEIDVRPGWDYSIYATLFTAGVTESEKSNTLYINLDIPIHDVETEEMLARAVDIFKGSWPMIAILMGLVIAAKIVQVITKYLQRV